MKYTLSVVALLGLWILFFFLCAYHPANDPQPLENNYRGIPSHAVELLVKAQFEPLNKQEVDTLITYFPEE